MNFFEEDLQESHKRWRKRNPHKVLWYSVTRKVSSTRLRIKWAFQRMFRGYDDRAYWGLDTYIAGIVIPTLKYIKEKKNGIPYIKEVENFDEKEWDKILDKIMLAMTYILNDEGYKYDDKIEEGLKLFGEYFQRLWS